MGDSGAESKDDKSRQDGPDSKGCPHKTSNIRSSGNTSDIKDLLTSCDQCIQDLLTASDSHIKEILTPSDTCIKQLLTPRRERLQRIQRLKVLCERLEAKMGDSGEESEDDKSRRDGPGPKGCPHKTSNIRSSGNTSDIKDLLTSCDQCIQELLKASDSYIKEILAPSDTCIKQLLTPTDSNIRHLLSLTNSCRKDQHIACDSHVEDLTMLTPKYSNIRELIIHSDSCFRELHMSADACKDDMLSDSNVKDLLTPRDSAIIEILQPKDYCINRLLTTGDSYTDTSLTPGDSYIQELFTPRDSYTNKLLLPSDSYANELLTPGDSYIQELLISRDSYTNESITPGHSFTNTSLTPEDSYIQELLAPRDSYTKESLKPGDSYIQDFLTPRDSDIQELLTTGDSPTNESLTQGDSYIQELLTPLHSYTNKSRTGVERESSRQGDKQISLASSLDSDALQHGPSGGKEMANTSSRSSCHKTDSLKGTADVMLSQQPYLTELLLRKAGDVELNPGPSHGSIDSVLQESEFILLAKEVPVDCYNILCTNLGFSLTQSETVLTQHHFNFPGALIHFFCKWKVKQRDGTNIRALLGEILKNADMYELQTKLLEGEYLTSGTSLSDTILDISQPNMTEAQVLQCGEDLKTFYREQMCKIEPDPLDFNIIWEFQQIYTNLTLLTKEMGSRKTEKPLDYTDLLTTKINGVLPKRLLVEGEGGVGKTTFCSKIAWDWVNRSPEFQCFSWVLVIPLRNVVKGQTIGDIMKNYLSDNNTVNPKQIDDYILSQPTKVLIVLDGLDEYDGNLSAKERSDISQILRLEKFKQCIVLVTTRPWRANKIKSNERLRRLYAFIAVKGFSAENVSKYISNYFKNDKNAGSELCRFIEVNDVIKENMAPFPIYVAMLCILWKNCDSEERETIRRLKTFSQLFDQMIMFLRDHYVSKVAHQVEEMENINLFLQRIGSIAFSGLLKKKLVFKEEDFSSCKEAMETCCRIGVLSQENENVSRWKRTLTTSQPVTTSVFFPHKLFQEYIASVYLASLYDTDCEEYSRSMGEVLNKNPHEFRYLLYFTAALGKEVGLDIIQKIQQNEFHNVQQRRRHNDFLADITFEAYNKDTAKAVGPRIFADKKILTIDKDLPAHTISGYLFIMEQHGKETLVFRDRSCGPTVSRDLADVLFASNSLSRLEFHCTTLDDDFYQLMQRQVSTMAGDNSSIKELVVDHHFINGLQTINNGDINVTVGDLFPSLKQLTFTTTKTVSPGDVERLAHSSLAVLSIEHGKKGRYLVPLIGEPTSLGQLFSSSFPQLTCLTFRGLVMGNIRSEAILCNLKNHLHLKSISIISCFTDNKLNFPAKQLTTENTMKITLQHKKAQRTLSFNSSIGPLTIDMIDALCHQTCVYQLDMIGKDAKIAGKECFPDFHGREVDSKIYVLNIKDLRLHDDQSASFCLGKFLSLLPHLTDLKIHSCSFHDDFYKEIVDRASSSKIHMLNIGDLRLHDNQSASWCLGKFLSLLSHLTHLEIQSCSLHDDFYKEIVEKASSSIKGDKSPIKELVVDYQFLNGLQRFNNGDIDVTIEDLFPSLKQLTFTTTQTVSSGVVEWLAHSNLAVLSIEHGKKGRYLVPLIGQPTSLGQLFSSSFPQLTCLTFRELVMGNIRSEAILRSLKNHLHLKSISIISCFTDDDLDPLVEQITTEKRMKITLQHDTAQRKLSFGSSTGPLTIDMIDALCHRTCVHHLEVNGVEIASEECFPDFQGRKVDSKIQTSKVSNIDLRRNQSASCCLGKFVGLQSRLTDLKIYSCDFHDDFFEEIADLASSSQIQTVNLDFSWNFNMPFEVVSQPASMQLAKFLCSLPCLTNLAFNKEDYLHDDFFTELESLAASSQNPYFRENQHTSTLKMWSARKQKQRSAIKLQQQQQQLNQCEMPMTTQPSGQFQSYPQRDIQSEPEQINQSTSYQQHSPTTPLQSTFAPDQLTIREEFEQSYLSAQHNASNGHGTQYSANSISQETQQHSPHHGLREATQDTAASQRQADATPIETDETSLESSSEYTDCLTSVYKGGVSIGMKPIYENDDNLAMPSTSGLSSAQSRTDAGPVGSELIPEHHKHIHSDDDDDDGDRVDESLEQRP